MKKLLIAVLITLSLGTPASANEYYWQQLQTEGNTNYQPTNFTTSRQSTINKDIIPGEKIVSDISRDEYLNKINAQDYFLMDTCHKLYHKSSTIKQACQDGTKKLSQLYSDFSKDNLTEKEFDLLKTIYNNLEDEISQTINQAIIALYD